MKQLLQTRLDAATHRRYAAVAKMEDAMHRMTIAERNGGAPDPADAEAFAAGRGDVITVDVELRELNAEAQRSLPDGPRIDVRGASGMPDFDTPDTASRAMMGPSHHAPGRIDVAPLQRALAQSRDGTTGRMVLRTLLQGVAAGNLGRTTANGGAVPVGSYGAVPLVLAVQTIPTDAGQFFWNKVEAVTAPAMGAEQTAEGDTKANVVLKSTPVTSTLKTYAAYEKVSLQSLQDQFGLAAAVEGLLTGAVLRAADADAWTAFVAGSTAVTAEADSVSTIVKMAARVAQAGGGGIRALLSPLDYATMMLTKADTSGNWMGLPPGVDMPTLVQCTGIPSGKLLVTAGTDGAFVALRQSVESSIGLSGDDFVKNLRTVLVEGRMVSAVRNPELSFAGNLHS